jgi:hypothetical protein
MTDVNATAAAVDTTLQSDATTSKTDVTGDVAAAKTDAAAAIAAATTSATTAIAHIENSGVVSNELQTAKSYLKTAIEWIEAQVKAIESAV